MRNPAQEDVKKDAQRIINEFALIRKAKGISQQKLADMTGQKQPVIANMELYRDVHMSTLLKSLHGLGYTLTVIPTFEQWLYEHGYFIHNEENNTYQRSKYDKESSYEMLYVKYVRERGTEIDML